MSDSYLAKRAHQHSMLRSVIEGTRLAHVWESPRYPGAEMVIQYRWPEVEVAEDDHGLPAAFAEDVELTYTGTMTPGRAASKLASMCVAEQSLALGAEIVPVSVSAGDASIAGNRSDPIYGSPIQHMHSGILAAGPDVWAGQPNTTL